MSVYGQVNTNLQMIRYRPGMAEKRRRPGSPKGQPKPAKRALDPSFPRRLKGAFALHPGLKVPQLAADIGCTRAVLHNYLNGKNKTIEALLLYELADALDVSARWLLTGEGAMARNIALTPDQTRVLQTLDHLVDGGLRDYWISQGEELRRRQPALRASASDPYTGAGLPGTNNVTPTRKKEKHR